VFGYQAENSMPGTNEAPDFGENKQLAAQLINQGKFMFQDLSLTSRSRAQEILNTTDSTWLLRLSEGRVEVYEDRRVSYGLNLVLSCKAKTGEIEHLPLISTTPAVLKNGCEVAFFLDAKREAHNTLAFLPAAIEALHSKKTDSMPASPQNNNPPRLRYLKRTRNTNDRVRNPDRLQQGNTSSNNNNNASGGDVQMSTSSNNAANYSHNNANNNNANNNNNNNANGSGSKDKQGGKYLDKKQS
jgi:hypothetical protein